MPDPTMELHRFTFGKLISGRTQSGPIVNGYEHQITGLSRNFPSDLKRACQPATAFKSWPGVQQVVDTTWAPQGAFLYRPIRVDSGDYGVFSRLQGREESGTGRGGRTYTHHSGLVCDLGDWNPILIWAAYQELFLENRAGICTGGPDLEEDTSRLEKESFYVVAADALHARNHSFPGEDAAAIWASETAKQVHLEYLDPACSEHSDRPKLPDMTQAVKDAGNILESLEAALTPNERNRLPTHLQFRARMVPFGIGIDPQYDGKGDGFQLKYWQGETGIRISFPRVFNIQDIANLEPCYFDPQGEPRWKTPLSALQPKKPAASETQWKSGSNDTASHADLVSRWRKFDSWLEHSSKSKEGALSHFAKLVAHSMNQPDLSAMLNFRTTRGYHEVFALSDVSQIAQLNRKVIVPRLDADAQIPDLGRLEHIAETLAALAEPEPERTSQQHTGDAIFHEKLRAVLALRFVNFFDRHRAEIGGRRNVWALILFEALALERSTAATALHIYAAAFERHMTHVSSSQRTRASASTQKKIGALGGREKPSKRFPAFGPATNLVLSHPYLEIPASERKRINSLVFSVDDRVLENIIKFDASNLSELELFTPPFSTPIAERSGLFGRTLGNVVHRSKRMLQKLRRKDSVR